MLTGIDDDYWDTFIPCACFGGMIGLLIGAWVFHAVF